MKKLLWGLLFSVSLGVEALVAGQDPNYTLITGNPDGTSIDATSGKSFSVSTFLDFPNGLALRGISYGVCHDAALVDPVDVAVGAALSGSNNGSGPDFFAPATPSLPSPGYTLGMVVSLVGADTLAPTTEAEIAVVTYDALAEGTSPLTFCDTGEPIVVLTVGVIGGGEIVPVTQDGEIVVTVPLSDYSLIPGSLDGSPIEGPIGSSFPVSTFLDFSEGEGVTGISFGICHDPAVVEIECTGGTPNDCVTNGVIVPGVDLAAVNGGTGPDFFAPAAPLLPEPGFTVGVVINLTGGGTLSPAAGAEIVVTTYHGISVGTTPLVPCETGDPLVLTTVGTIGGSSTLNLLEGAIEVTRVNPDYKLATGTTDGSPVVCAVGALVGVPTFLDFADGVAVSGLSFGICHDPAVVDIDCSGDCVGNGIITPGNDLLSLNGGSGPDFFAPQTLSNPEPGYTLGVVISLTSADFLPATENAEIAVASYRCLDAGSSPLVPCEIGDPTVLIRVGTVGASDIIPLNQSGSLEVNRVLFQRGDTNMDSFVDISDGIYLARHIFVSSQMFPLTCRDAGDANNDDGNLGIADIIHILNALLGTGVIIEPPFGSCGTDTVNPDCLFFDANACP